MHYSFLVSMKNDLKRVEIADVQADCTVPGLAGSFHPLAGLFRRRGGGTEGWRGGVQALFLDSRSLQ